MKKKKLQAALLTGLCCAMLCACAQKAGGSAGAPAASAAPAPAAPPVVFAAGSVPADAVELRLPGEGPVGLQLFGREPEFMAEAARQLESLDFPFFDINMGCPAPKIAGNGEGIKHFRNVKGRVRSIKYVDNGEELTFIQKWDDLFISAPACPYGSNYVVRVAEAEIEAE